MARNVDSHIHSYFSDGVLSPESILRKAKANGLKKISVTDHDTVSAYTDEFFRLAEELGIEVVSGVEISTTYNGSGFHVLGYDIDLKNETLLKTLDALNSARRDYLFAVSKILQSFGFVVNVKKISKERSITKAHIAKDIVTNYQNEELLIETFGHIPNKGEFIETLMNEGCPAYVEKFTITPMQASDIIHGAGGKVVLAHPVAYFYEDGVTEEEICNLLKLMKADGLEANYIYVDRRDMVHNDSEYWNEVAKKNNLFVTTGSDFHSMDGIRPDIGFANINEAELGF